MGLAVKYGNFADIFMGEKEGLYWRQGDGEKAWVNVMYLYAYSRVYHRKYSGRRAGRHHKGET